MCVEDAYFYASCKMIIFILTTFGLHISEQCIKQYGSP